MTILIDMNLSPLWVDLFLEAGIEAVHWSSIGAATASDSTLFIYAQGHAYTIFTHDLDFGAILAATKNQTPSVIQLRDEDIYPSRTNVEFLKKILLQFEAELLAGALITIDKNRTKVRILPIA